MNLVFEDLFEKETFAQMELQKALFGRKKLELAGMLMEIGILFSFTKSQKLKLLLRG